MNFLDWVRNAVQHFLWSNDIDVFAVSNSFADEWHVLQAENGETLLLEDLEASTVIAVSESVYHLTIESTLAEHTPDQCTVLDVWFNLFYDVIFSVSW